MLLVLAALAGALGCNALWGLDDLQFGTGGATSTATGTGGAGVADGGKDGGTGDGGDGGSCADDAECAGSPNGSVCDPATRTCVACLMPAHPCPVGEYCDSSRKCQPGCSSNADCTPPGKGGTGTGGAGAGSAGTGGAGTGGAGTGAEGPGDGGPGPVDAGAVTCDLPTHTCVGCTADAECPLGTLCTSSRCLAGCSATHGCQAGHSCCDGACLVTNTTDSVSACGACAVACSSLHGAPSCIGGTCLIACNAGYGDCDGNPANGCETSVVADPGHCGACGTICGTANTTAVACVAGACQLACANGWGSCDGNPANGCETNLATSLTSCGACGVACTNANGTTACIDGNCVPTCVAGSADCDGDPRNGCEASLATASHCGSCIVACIQQNGANDCVGGACVPVCDVGFGDCDNDPIDGCEANLSTDPKNCGSCGLECAALNGTSACVNGGCVPTCNMGFGDCDGNPSNGCETNLRIDAANCGACASPCTAQNGTTSCAGGVCTPVCNGGFADCDGNPANGCEANLGTDLGHCGSCATVCGAGNATPACQGGTCAEVCVAGYSDCDGLPGNGCECEGTACCGSGCQTKHNNGFGGFYYDCIAAGPPYGQQMALDACAAVTGSVAKCMSLGCPGNNQTICTNVPGQSTCQCWDYAGKSAGYASTGTSCSCPGGSTTFPWN